MSEGCSKSNEQPKLSGDSIVWETPRSLGDFSKPVVSRCLKSLPDREFAVVDDESIDSNESGFVPYDSELVACQEQRLNLQDNRGFVYPRHFNEYKPVIDSTVSDLVEGGSISLVPSLVTSRHSGGFASVMCPNCGDVLSFQKSCSDKFCLVCGAIRGKRIMKDFLSEIEKMEHPKFLTLTLKSQMLSRELLFRIRKSFRALLRRKDWSEKYHCKGGFYVLELGTLKDTGLWNIHIHAVIDSDYIPQDWISVEWLKITGDSMIVDIRQVRSYRYAVWYLQKYVAKPITEKERELTFLEKNFVNSVLRGQRRIQRFGDSLHESVVDDARTPLPDRSRCRNCGHISSMISLDNEIQPIIKSWHKETGYYAKRHKELALANDKLPNFRWVGRDWHFKQVVLDV